MRGYDFHHVKKRFSSYVDPQKPKPMGKKTKLIAQANELVRIEWVLRDLFDIYVPEGAQAWRTHCPWRTEHSDKGVAKTLRVYAETNTSMCFASHGHFTPVRLWSYQEKMSFSDAARVMMKAYQVGPVKENYRAKMARLLKPQVPTPVDIPLVLQYLLPTHPKYIRHQYDDRVRETVIAWSEFEFSSDVEEMKVQFNQWKVKLWKLLDALS